MSCGDRRRITHVIFDVDGLLLDTESLYTETTQDICSQYGKTFDWSVKSRMMGRRPLEAAKMLVDALELPLSAEEFNSELYKRLTPRFPDAKLMPGADALMKHFHNLGIPMALATGSANPALLVKISKRKELFSLCLHAVCSDDSEVKNGKPAPDIYLIAAKRFPVPPDSSQNVLVFEDAPNGVQAAKDAGMNVVMVPDERTDRDKCKMADRVLGSLEDVDLSEWGLPVLNL